MRVASATTPPSSTFAARSSHAPKASDDVTLELDVISPSQHHDQPATDAASVLPPLAPLRSSQSHHVVPEPPRSRSRSAHRPTASTAATDASAAHSSTDMQAGPSAAKVGKIQLITLSPASRASQSTAHKLGIQQSITLQSPPPSHSKSRAVDDASSSAANGGPMQHSPPAAAAGPRAPLSSTVQAEDTAAHARLREHARSISSKQPQDSSPPPLTLLQRMRAAGAELEEC